MYDYKKALKIKAFKNYQVSVQKEYGFYYFIKSFKKQIGIMAGIASILVLFFFSSFTFYINILGNSTIESEQIINFLNENNIMVGRRNNESNENIENLLKQKFEQISLVSVIKRGTNLIITYLEVNQGTALKRVGDIVQKGEPLVAPCILNQNQEKVYCNPIATIEAEGWYFGQTELETKEIVYKKTGKKTVTSSFVAIFNKTMLTTQKTCNYKYFTETESTVSPFNNFFVPITVYKHTIYELKQNVIVRDFEKNKAELMKTSKTLAYQNKPSNLDVIEEVIVVSQIGTKYIVQTALKTHLQLSYN